MSSPSEMMWTSGSIRLILLISMVGLSSCSILIEGSRLSLPHLGDWIWGRGSADDKSSVIGIMCADRRPHTSQQSLVACCLTFFDRWTRNTIELLLTHGFMPARTIVLAFGMDEERWGADVSVPCTHKNSDSAELFDLSGWPCHAQVPHPDVWNGRLFLPFG